MTWDLNRWMSSEKNLNLSQKQQKDVVPKIASPDAMDQSCYDPKFEIFDILNISVQWQVRFPIFAFFIIYHLRLEFAWWIVNTTEIKSSLQLFVYLGVHTRVWSGRAFKDTISCMSALKVTTASAVVLVLRVSLTAPQVHITSSLLHPQS